MRQISLDLGPDNDDFGVMSDINVTPFIDVMLVLLIIFMVTAPLMMAAVPLNLPKGATQRLEKMNTRPLIISLDREKRIYVGEEEVTADDHHAFFNQLAQESDDGAVYVRGDKDIAYGEMVDLMAKLGKAGFARVILVTEAEGSEATPMASDPGPVEKTETAAAALPLQAMGMP